MDYQLHFVIFTIIYVIGSLITYSFWTIACRVLDGAWPDGVSQRAVLISMMVWPMFMFCLVAKIIKNVKKRAK